MTAISSNSKAKINRYFSLILAIAFIIILVLVISFVVKVSKGVAVTADTPEYLIRLQVLNGSSVSGLTSKMSNYLADYKDNELEITIVDTDDFTLKKIPGTFIISRVKDKSASVLLAKKLGLEHSNIIYKPLENNYRQVSTTLVLGNDYKMMKLPELLKRSKRKKN